MKVIDAEALKEKVKEGCKRCIHEWNSRCEVCSINAFLRTIDNAPTVRPSLVLKDMTEEDFENFKVAYQRATSKGLIINTERPHGKWIYPYHDTIIGKKRVGKSIKQCSECEAYFCNNIPCDAKYCPICGSYNEESNGNAVDNI